MSWVSNCRLAFLSLLAAPVTCGQVCHPTVVGSLAGTPTDVVVAENIAYVASGLGGVDILDCSDPLSPVLIGRLPVEAVGEVEVSGGTLYVADVNRLMFFDITDPSNPILLGEYDPIFVSGVAVDGSTVFVGGTGTPGPGLHILDLAEPAEPRLLSVIPGGWPLDIEIVGSTLIYVDNESARLIDISDLAAPQVLLTYYSQNGAVQSVDVVGSIAYFGAVRGLDVVDLSVPTVPVRLGSARTTFRCLDVQVVGNSLFTSSTGSRMDIFDVTDPATPQFLGSYRTTAERFDIHGDMAYLAESSALRLVSVLDPALPELVSSVPALDEAVAVAIVGTTAFIASSSNQRGGLRTSDVSSASQPTLNGVLDIDRPVHGIDVSGDIACLVLEGTYGGLLIIDVSDPAAPSPISQWSIDGEVMAVSLEGTTAYVSAESSTSAPDFYVLDLSQPETPVVVGSINVPGSVVEAHVVGPKAYLAAGVAGMHIVALEDPAAPVLMATLDTPGSARSVAVIDDVAFVADNNRVQIVDISNSAQPVIASAITNRRAKRVQVVGELLYVADAGVSIGFDVFDVSDPLFPIDKGRTRLPRTIQDFTVDGTRLYAALGKAGLTIVETAFCQCAADLDADNVVDVFDLLAYLDLWFSSDPSAELMGDDPIFIDVLDLLAYLDLWFAGCA